MGSIARMRAAAGAALLVAAPLVTALPVSAVGSAYAAGPARPADAACTAPTGVTCTYGVHYGKGGTHTLDVYVPTGASGEPAVVIIHGGGWLGGNSRGLHDEAVYFAQNGFAVFSVNYQLSTPESPSWPSVLDDVEAATGWVADHAADYAADGSRIGVFGGSAGGHLAALLDTRGQQDGVTTRVAVAWSGPMDLPLTYQDGDDELRGEVQQLLGCVPGACAGNADADASPTHHVSSATGPLLFFNSSDELTPVSGAKLMNKRLAKAGVEHSLVVLKHTRKHAAEYECHPETVLGVSAPVIDGTVRWLGKYLNGVETTPTGDFC